MTATRYHMDDCVVSVPPGAHDASVHMLDWPVGDVDKLSLIVQRAKVATAEEFEAFVVDETKPYASRFTGYHLDRETKDDDRWEGRLLRGLEFRWKKGADVLYYHQVFVFDSGRALVFTASAKARYRVEVDELVATVINELALRED